MDTSTHSQVDRGRQVSRAELEKTMQLWLDANRRAEATGDWKTTLGAHYTDDAEYRWDLGPDETFVARGVNEIKEVAIGYQMQGFEGWTYPYHRVVLDEVKGEAVGFWRQISPYKRPDGSFYEVPGLCGSWFRYGGDYKWSHQHDFFDLGSVIATLRDLAAAGLLPEPLKKKMQMLARGHRMPGHEPRPGRASALHKLRGNLALARIALLGR
ncbi:MAG TPA: hypothetical protein VG963_15875 [Polyangiaceae bacterium]|nr:hypothetical protein [Polyangiaceae bacterium]